MHGLTRALTTAGAILFATIMMSIPAHAGAGCSAWDQNTSSYVNRWDGNFAYINGQMVQCQNGTYVPWG
ncbi:hypothetical protein [Nonomuraea ceibae]|uniref:hypothetical protein n=1 Tax=Nonomuraea ceibae TaxID=1935170 RepID=UPI001C600AAD|nr:hypothetical protein [Nonomuraea ceibae]